jgi:Flp pilus assembly protein CpaB
MARTLLRTDRNGADQAEPAPRPARDVVALSQPTRRRPSWVLIGSLLVGVAALLGAWVFAATADRVSVMVAAHDIDPGEIVGAGDLQVIEIGASDQLRAVQPSQQELIVGRAARGPIPAGTVLNTDLFADRDQTVPKGMAVVGAALEQGAAPTASLRAGDRVDVLGAVRTSGAPGEGTGSSAQLLATGTVWSVEQATTGSTSTLWVSIVVPAEVQGLVAQAAADGLLRLSLVGAG